MKAMLLAAGFGTRLKPFTDHHPKALAPVNGVPVLLHNIRYLQSYGFWDIVINVHHFAEQIFEFLEAGDGWGSQVFVSHEKEILETGGGIQEAMPLFGESQDLLVMNADILTDLDLNALMGYHFHEKADATLVTRQRETSRYFLFDEENRLSGWQNVKTGESKIRRETTTLHPSAFSGLQILNESIFRHMPFTGKFSTVDVYLDMCNTHKILEFDHTAGRFADIGTEEKRLSAEKMFAENWY